jgi:tetratricopeptide (TPR) repeat protein
MRRQLSGEPSSRASAPSQRAARLAGLTNEAVRLRRSGRSTEAVPLMINAVQLLPDHAGLLQDLGLTCLEARQFKRAVPAFRRALALRPNFAEAAFGSAVALEKLSDPNGAIAALRRAVQIRPSYDEAWFMLALLLEDAGEVQDAVAAYRRTRACSRNKRRAKLAEARALLLERRDDELLAVLRRAIAADGKDAAAYELLGHVFSRAGDFDEAFVCHERALEIDPGLVGSYYELVRCRRITPADAPLVARMQRAAENDELEPRPQTKLYLAIGKAFDDLGEYAEAMKAFDAAQAARERRAKFDLDAFNLSVDRLIAQFPGSLMAQASSIGVSDPTPVFILGLPRSGTTLCEQIVSSHPDVTGGDELTFWNDVGGRLGASVPLQVDPQSIGQSSRSYLDYIRRIGPGAQRITDKMPFNFHWIGLIHLALPAAKIIHCRRQLVDNALSIHQTFFAERHNIPTGGVELVGFCRGYERLMAHWRRVIPSETLVEVDYEDVTGELEPVARRLISSLGLDWSPACLRPELNQRKVLTASRWQARQPIYRTSIDRWRRYEDVLGPLAQLIPEGKANASLQTPAQDR